MRLNPMKINPLTRKTKPRSEKDCHFTGIGLGKSFAERVSSRRKLKQSYSARWSNAKSYPMAYRNAMTSAEPLERPTSNHDPVRMHHWGGPRHCIQIGLGTCGFEMRAGANHG